MNYIDTTNEILKLIPKIFGNGTMIVETVNEALLVKLLEIRGTPIKIKKSYRDINKDFEREYGTKQ